MMDVVGGQAWRPARRLSVLRLPVILLIGVIWRTENDTRNLLYMRAAPISAVFRSGLKNGVLTTLAVTL